MDAAVKSLAEIMERVTNSLIEMHGRDFILAAGVLIADADGQGMSDDEHTLLVDMLLPLTAEPTALANAAFTIWQRRWTERLSRQPQPWPEVLRLMNAHNPAVIPRNHEVEAALTAATAGNDLTPLQRLHAALATPYDEANQPDGLLNPPPPGTPTCRAFCGT